MILFPSVRTWRMAAITLTILLVSCVAQSLNTLAKRIIVVSLPKLQVELRFKQE